MALPNIGLNVESPANFCKTGDTVVGRYTDSGRKVGENDLIGNDEAKRKLASSIARHSRGAANSVYVEPGSEQHVTVSEELQAPKIVKTAKGKGVKRPSPALLASLTPTPPPPPAPPIYKTETKPVETSFSVVFHNKFGKIKLNVIGVLDEKHAVCLIFKNDNAIIFTPEYGEVFDLVLPTNKVVKVCYPQTTFTWIDNEKKIMLLLKED